MSKCKELENIKLNISSVIWQIRNFTPLSKEAENHLDEALDYADHMTVSVMLATAKEEGA